MTNKSKTLTVGLRMALVMGLCLGIGPMTAMSAEENQEKSTPKPAVKTAREEIRAFCANIADAARDQRYALQRTELEKLQTQVDERIAVLEKRKAEYEDWMKKRDAFSKQAEAGLVDIYKKMAPDAAAQQLELIDPNLASAIVMKLSPAKSSLILTEMEAKKAALVASIISAAGNRSTSRDPS
ncbi:MotE family protein [Rhizobium sp. FKL33]|uniref:MotE family protein n=1 Tax=Rhizobium sp. FKL33 TaxID=2562307 RepID=UPI0010C0706B|nr:MotE family protein [Rhizobium sp. FKL33]